MVYLVPTHFRLKLKTRLVLLQSIKDSMPKKESQTVTPSPSIRTMRAKVPVHYKPESENEEEYKAPVKRRRDNKAAVETPSQKMRISPAKKLKVEPVKDLKHSCVLGCSEDIDEEILDLRYHYTSHYYIEAMAFSLEQHPMLRLLDTEDKAKLVAAFKGLGQEKKYGCVLQEKENCSKRKMSFYEFISHHAIIHQQVKQMMRNDVRPGMAGIHAKVYPEQENKLSRIHNTVSSSFLETDTGEEADDPRPPFIFQQTKEK